MNNLELYKTFYYVAKAGSITAAAQQLSLTQPAVSQSMKQLEAQLNVSLFQRTAKGIRLTKEGEILFPYAESCCESIRQGEQKLKELMNLDLGEIRIGASDMTLKYYLLPFLEQFHRRYPKIKVIGVEPKNAASMTEALKNDGPVTLPSANTIADGTAVKRVGTKIFPYCKENIAQMLTVDDSRLIGAFLNMVENHKMIVENSGLLPVAALDQLDLKGKKAVLVLSGGNMDVITMSSVVQHGLIQQDRIFTVSVLLPDKAGELVKVAAAIADQNGNVIKLEHNQFVSINRNASVELRITMESYGTNHKQQILKALEEKGYHPKVVDTKLY